MAEPWVTRDLLLVAVLGAIPLDGDVASYEPPPKGLRCTFPACDAAHNSIH